MHFQIGLFLIACLVFSFKFAHPFISLKIAVLLLLFLVLGRSEKRKLPWRHALVLVWALWPVWMPIAPLDPVPAIYQRGLWLVYVMVAFFVWPLSPANRDAIRASLGWSSLLVAIYAVCQWLGWDWVIYETAGQANSFFGNPNFTAHFLLLAWFTAKFFNRKWAAIGYSAMAVAMLMSGSRAVIGLWIMGIVLLHAYKIGARKGVFAACTLSVMAVAFWGHRDIPVFLHYVSQPTRYVSEFRDQPSLIANRDAWFRGKRLSLMTRVSLYSNSQQLVWDHPFGGIGAGQFRAHYPTVAQSHMPDVHLSDSYRASSTHQVILEMAILYGVPWLLIGFGLLWFACRKLQDKRFLWGVIGQILLAQVSLNYQSPIILITMILLWPPNQPRPSQARRPWSWLGLLWLLPLLFIVGLDALHGQAQRQIHWRAVPGFFPALRAAKAFEDHALGPAWRAQKAALSRDPYGPETIFNTGLVAWALGEAGDPKGFEFAIQAFQLNRALHPDYAPAEKRLDTMVGMGMWLPKWSQWPLLKDPWEARTIWARSVLRWQPNVVHSETQKDAP